MTNIELVLAVWGIGSFLFLWVTQIGRAELEDIKDELDLVKHGAEDLAFVKEHMKGRCHGEFKLHTRNPKRVAAIGHYLYSYTAPNGARVKYSYGEKEVYYSPSDFGTFFTWQEKSVETSDEQLEKITGSLKIGRGSPRKKRAKKGATK